MADRVAKHLEDAVRGMEGRFVGSHMAWHTLEMHPGEQPKFGMMIVRTYTGAFTLAMGEVIRIFYRSRLLQGRGLCNILLAQLIHQ